MTRLAARVDTAQRGVVAALRGVGASVHSLATVGRGCPDLLVGYRGVTLLIEVKSPGTARKRVEAPAQMAWRSRWRGGQAVVVSTPDEALLAIGAKR